MLTLTAFFRVPPAVGPSGEGLERQVEECEPAQAEQICIQTPKP